MEITTESFNLKTLDIISHEHYTNGYPHREWTYLRQRAPVYYYDRSNVEPFWAITKHVDIVTIARQPKLFLNGPRLMIVTKDQALEGGKPLYRTVGMMDPPEHAAYRDLVNRRFTPRAVRSLEQEVIEIANAAMDELESLRYGGSTIDCDFVADVSAKVPLDVIGALLGFPKADQPQLFQWTNETIGSADPEIQMGASSQETQRRARDGLFTYFGDLVEQRRKDPQEDLTTVLAQCHLNGDPLPLFEMLSYFLLLAVAGNETTRNTTSGGMLAFIENPDQWRMLRNNPSLRRPAVEEILRWTSPAIQFARTATEDFELRGQKILQGESVALFYASGNRDEEVFNQPFNFDITRNPNPHLTFGIGEHFCLGANLARLELDVILGEVMKRFESVELTGPVKRLKSSFTGGIKQMPVRIKLRPRPY